MKRSVFLIAVFLVLFAGFQESASAQERLVRVQLSDRLGNLEIKVKPWRVEIPQANSPRGFRIILTDHTGQFSTITLNNTRYGKNVPGCDPFALDPVDITSPGGSAPGNAEIAFNPQSTVGQWCSYNIILVAAGAAETVTIDPDFRIR